MQKNPNGLLITFEGPDGGGKTTQANLLKEFLEEKRFEVVSYREPGGTLLGEEIRKVVHASMNSPVSPRAETLLYQDRFTDSTRAYQGEARGLGIENIAWLNNFATTGLVPSLTFLLDISPEKGLKRRETNGLELNRLDNEALEFHSKVRNAYLAMAKSDSNRWVVINAELSPELVEAKIRKTSLERLGQLAC